MAGIELLPVENLSPTAVVITSTTVIGIVGTAVVAVLSEDLVLQLADTSKAGLLRFSTAKKAIEAFGECAGTIREDLHDIYMQNVKSPIIISLVEITEAESEKSPFNFYDNPEIKTDVLNALDNLKMAKTVLAEKVRIPIVGWFTHDADVLDAVNSYTSATKTISIVNLKSENISNALIDLKKLASKRYLCFPFYRKVWSIFEDAEIEKPYSAIVAGHIARWDAKLKEFGPCYDHANRDIFNMGLCLVPLFYEEGENTCDVNMITNAGGALCISDDVMGNILYNFESPSDDTRFNKLETLRYFDLINEENQKALKKHKHRPLKEVLNLAKADIETFLLKSKKAEVTVGFDCWWSDRNSATDISAGILYLDWKASNNLGIRTIVLQANATSEYYTVEV